VLSKFSWLKKKRFSIPLFITLVVLFAIFWFYKIELPKYFVRINTNTSAKITYLAFDQSLEIALKKTFSDNQYSQIRTYLSLASAEKKDINSRYNYLVRAYQNMVLAYNQTKKAEFKDAISLLNRYLENYPQYNSDTLPKIT